MAIESSAVKLATWNINSLRLRMPQVLQWLSLANPDVLCLQETKVADELFPIAPLQDAGYQVAFSGQKAYNGVAIISRQPMTDVVAGIEGFADEQKRCLAATIDGVRVMSVYVPNGERVGSEKFAYKLRWLAAMNAWMPSQLQRYDQLLITGDFNIAPGDDDVFDPVAWAGHVLCSEEERTALGKLLAHGLTDIYRTFHQGPGHFTWWDYREFSFQRNRGVRIDHVMVSAPLAQRCHAAHIHRETRKWEKPSDHVPLLVEWQ